MITLKDLTAKQLEDAQIAMTLSALAYDTPSNIGNLLTNKNLATKNKWGVAWGPFIHESNLVFVAKNKTSDDYMVTIRGTIFDLWSIFIDIDSFYLTNLPWDSNDQKMISYGMSDAWSHVKAMNSGNGQLSLEKFIDGIPSNSNIFVTGHSQGGALASVVAFWLYDTFHSKQNIIPYTFAGETAGNVDFANAYNKRFVSGSSNGLRFFNDIDIVPKGFADLASIKSLYSPQPPYVECPEFYKDTIDLLIKHLPTYVQPDAGVSLPGPMVKIKGEVDFWNRRSLFRKELGIQHNHLTYLTLLGANMTAGAPKVWPPVDIPA